MPYTTPVAPQQPRQVIRTALEPMFPEHGELLASVACELQEAAQLGSLGRLHEAMARWGHTSTDQLSEQVGQEVAASAGEAVGLLQSFVRAASLADATSRREVVQRVVQALAALHSIASYAEALGLPTRPAVTMQLCSRAIGGELNRVGRGLSRGA
jgi:hypothetical protein